MRKCKIFLLLAVMSLCLAACTFGTQDIINTDSPPSGETTDQTTPSQDIPQKADTSWRAVPENDPLRYEAYFSEVRQFRYTSPTYKNCWWLDKDGKAVDVTVDTDRTDMQNYALCHDQYGFFIVDPPEELFAANIDGARKGDDYYSRSTQMPVIWDVPGSENLRSIDDYVTDGIYAYCVLDHNAIIRLDLLTGEVLTLAQDIIVPEGIEESIALYDQTLIFITAQENKVQINRLYLPNMVHDVLYGDIPLNGAIGEFSGSYLDSDTLYWRILDEAFIPRVMEILTNPDSGYRAYVPDPDSLWGLEDWEDITSHPNFMTIVQLMEIQNEIPSLLKCTYNISVNTYTQRAAYWDADMEKYNAANTTGTIE